MTDKYGGFKMGIIKKVVIITIATTLFTTPLTGCSKGKESLEKLEPTNSKSQNQQEGTKDSDSKTSSKKEETTLPGEDISAVIGESVVYKDEISIRLDKVHRVGAEKDGDKGYYAFVFTIENNSQENLGMTVISNFTLHENGKELKGAFTSSRAVTAALREIKDISPFADSVMAGTTLTGYAYAEAPLDFTEMKISIYPEKGVTGDTITFTFTSEDISPL